MYTVCAIERKRLQKYSNIRASKKSYTDESGRETGNSRAHVKCTMVERYYKFREAFWSFGKESFGNKDIEFVQSYAVSSHCVVQVELAVVSYRRAATLFASAFASCPPSWGVIRDKRRRNISSNFASVGTRRNKTNNPNSGKFVNLRTASNGVNWVP